MFRPSRMLDDNRVFLAVVAVELLLGMMFLVWIRGL
jgi:hypothetical protein